MKKLAALLSVLFCFVGLKAQEKVVTTITIPEQTAGTTNRVYAELIDSSADTFGFNKSVTVNVELGQYQSVFKPYTLITPKHSKKDSPPLSSQSNKNS